jgi:hypothetical protein
MQIRIYRQVAVLQVPVSKQASMLSSIQMQRVSSKDLMKAAGARDLGAKASGKDTSGQIPLSPPPLMRGHTKLRSFLPQAACGILKQPHAIDHLENK